MVPPHISKEALGMMPLHISRRERALTYPPPLARGDCIGLAAPASPISREEREACVETLEKLGFCVQLAKGLLGDRQSMQPSYFAGTARQRAEDLNRMFHDRRVQAVFCVRGGYGSAGILPFLDYQGIRKNPKIFVGYSDITAVHMALQRYSGLMTFHGPMVKSDLLKGHSGDWENLWSMVGREGELAARGRAVFQNPEGEEIRLLGGEMPEQRSIAGRLTGGNLSVLLKLAGTGYLPDMKDGILFLEDIHESAPRLHMGLIQLQQMGIFDQVKGVLLGDFTDCGLETEEMLCDFFREQRLPVLKNICSDHRERMGTLPLGALCEIHPARRKIRFFR